jgi:outer membrane protein
MKILKIVVAVSFVLAICNSTYAQKPLKLAHIDSQELMQSMPEWDSALVKMQKIQKDLQTEMEGLQVEYNRKLEEYANNQKNWTDLVRQSREQELRTLQQRMQEFQDAAGEDFQKEQAKLIQPIREKANKAIETVAKEQGITYVLEAQVLLFKATDSLDMLSLVQQQLGINNK